MVTEPLLSQSLGLELAAFLAAEQDALTPLMFRMHVNDQRPVPVTSETVPDEHRLDAGATLKKPALLVLQAPFKGMSSRPASPCVNTVTRVYVAA